MAFMHNTVLAVIVLLSGLFGTVSHQQNLAAAQLAWNPADAHILFGGDMMFDRSIRIAADKKGGDFIFSCIDPVFQKADLVVANLEGPITDQSSVSVTSRIGEPNNFVFTFPTTTAQLLYSHNVHMVNLGNNHIENFRSAGVSSTMDALRAAQVGYFGDPLAQTVATTSVKGIKFAFVNFNQFSNSSSPELTVQQIRAAHASGALVIVYTHWGEEYVPATFAERKWARQFIDAGAEMVIGSHPHVVQEHEAYLGKDIYYSLGNLIFDQYWNNDVRTGLVLAVTFQADGVHNVSEIPVYLERDRRTCPLR